MNITLFSSTQLDKTVLNLAIGHTFLSTEKT